MAHVGRCCRKAGDLSSFMATNNKTPHAHSYVQWHAAGCETTAAHQVLQVSWQVSALAPNRPQAPEHRCRVFVGAVIGASLVCGW
jgi:hypothetical protein